MAYANFIPELWSEQVQRANERAMVFAEDCNRAFEGEIKQFGDRVHILGVGKPTIHTLTKGNMDGSIAAAETVEDTSVLLDIDQMRYFNIKIGDVDRAQANSALMDILTKEAGVELSNEADKYIAGLILDKNVQKYAGSATQVTDSNVLDILDAGLQKLFEADVEANDTIVATVTPRFYTKFRKAYTVRDTDNSDALANGRVAKYGNIIIKVSNNVAKTESGATDNIMLRTQKAVAFANKISKMEAYRPESSFSDAVRGYMLFGAKIVRPYEIVNLNVKYTA